MSSDTKLLTRQGLTIFAIAVAVLASLDIATTCYGLSLGAMEANPLFQDAPMYATIMAKVGGTLLAVRLCLLIKSVVGLAVIAGVNLAAVVGNLLVILQMR